MVRKLACGSVLIACGLMLLKNTDVGVVLILRKNSDVNVGITYVRTAVAKGAGEKSYSTIILFNFIYFCQLAR